MSGTGDGRTGGASPAPTEEQERTAFAAGVNPRPTKEQERYTGRKKRMVSKGRMARRLVYYCIGVLTVTALWAAVVVTVAVVLDRSIDLSAVLTFIGGAFGGELLLLLLKRVFAKPKEDVE